MSMLLLLALMMFWVLFTRRQVRTVTNTCYKNTMTTAMMVTENMSGVELVWTERGERLHLSRDCPALKRSTHLRSKAICRICARDPK